MAKYKRKPKEYYMLVTNDKYELPLAIAETQTELVKLQRMSFKTIRRALKGQGRFKVIKIKLEEEK